MEGRSNKEGLENKEEEEETKEQYQKEKSVFDLNDGFEIIKRQPAGRGGSDYGDKLQKKLHNEEIS